ASRIAQSGTTFNFNSTAQNVVQGTCSNLASIELKDSSGQPILFTGSVGVPLVASPAVANFYSDASCSSAITLMPLNGSTAIGQFYFKASASGTVKISANLLSLIVASQNETVAAPAPSPAPAPAPTPAPAPAPSPAPPAPAPAPAPAPKPAPAPA